MKRFILAAILFVNMGFVAAQKQVPLEDNAFYSILQYVQGVPDECPMNTSEAPDWEFYCGVIKVSTPDAKAVVDEWAKANYWAAQNEWTVVQGGFWVRNFNYNGGEGLRTARFVLNGELRAFVFAHRPYQAIDLQ